MTEFPEMLPMGEWTNSHLSKDFTEGFLPQPPDVLDPFLFGNTQSVDGDQDAS
jgi:hypothetical protein